MYNRLFTKILDSSIWLEADTTRLIWITFLATMDEDGYAAFSSVENLSRRANIPLEETKQAVLVLEAPDKFNPNDEFEGRRIERVENGWMVLKGPLYRGLLSREIQREQTRLRVAKFRERKKLVTNQTLPNVTDVTVTQQSKAVQSTAVQSTHAGSNEPARVKEGKNSSPTSEDIYREYPRKVGKPDALKAISRAMKRFGCDFLLERTIAYAKTQEAGDRFTPYPSTWFNQERFNDSPDTWVRQKDERHLTARERARREEEAAIRAERLSFEKEREEKNE